MEGGADSEEFAQGGELPRRCQTADSVETDADEVDEALANERHILNRVGEELTKRDGRRTLASKKSQVLRIFGRNRIFEEEEPVRLECFGQLNRIDRRDALVHVMQELDVLPEARAEVLEEPRNDPAIGTRIPVLALPKITVHTIGRLTRDSHLAADEPKATGCARTRLLLHLLEVSPCRVHIDGKRHPTAATEKLIERHPCTFPFDIPQRHVDTTERMVEHRTIPEVGTEVGRLPDVFDIIDAPADQVWLEIMLDGSHHRKRPLGERCTAEPIKPWLRGLHFDDHQPNSFRSGTDCSYITDADSRFSARLPWWGGPAVSAHSPLLHQVPLSVVPVGKTVLPCLGRSRQRDGRAASMRIVDIKTAVLAGNFDWILVRVETDEGLSGLGEAYWGAGVVELIDAAKRLIIGENPLDVAKLLFKMQRGLSGAGAQAGATVTAISGIELALWDLVARALNTPLSTLFGGRFRSQIRVYADLHASEEPTPESWAARAKQAVEQGFTAIKFDLDAPNPYTRDISDDADPRRSWYEPYNRTVGSAERRYLQQVVAAVRETIGPDIMLALDCHWKYAVPDVIQLAHALEPYDPLWLEDPIPPDNVDALVTVARSTRIPICTGENHYRLQGFRELIERQACSIVAPDIPKMGGLLEARTVAAWADLYGMLVAPHNVCSPIGTVAAAHLCAAISNFLVLEFHALDVPWWDEIVLERPVIRNGFITLSDAPGHGLTLNEEVARAHAKPGTTFFGEPV